MPDALVAGQAELIARLRLIRSENVGPVTFRQLIARFGNARAALEALPDLARHGGRSALRIASAAEAEAEMARVERFGGQLLFRGLAPYPRRLAEIDDAPPVIAVRGQASLLDRPTVALVGARTASAAAMRFARGMAADLAAEGVVVVSGLARGIDAAAHAGALDGGTIAVIAGGLDIVYPPANADLHERIFAQGLIVAEQPMGLRTQARHFPRRNRIIAGLSLGVAIIEAAPRSGSLITARFAGEPGREVMAVPGSPLDPRAPGCNLLIREGAILVQSAADVVDPPDGAGRRRAGRGFRRRRIGARCRRLGPGGDHRAAQRGSGAGRRADPPVGARGGNGPGGAARARDRRPARPSCRRPRGLVPLIVGLPLTPYRE